LELIRVLTGCKISEYGLLDCVFRDTGEKEKKEVD
jgi:hypothetical protein